MTHDRDCAVRDEFRDEVDRVAALYADGQLEEAGEVAESMGWEKLGAGVARVAWRVTQEHQHGESDGSPTHEAPCVIKFSIGVNGRAQTTDEIRQFRQFPEAVKDADPPVFVPVADHDRDNRWLSMPEAQPGGSVEEVEYRLGKVGIQCGDLHSDNVGDMHGVSVLLDYGMDCTTIGRPNEIAEEVVEWLERRGTARDVGFEMDGEDASVTFLPPAGIADQGDPERSEVFITPGRGITYLSLKFGPWNDSDVDVRGAMEPVIDELESDWLVHGFVATDTDGGGVTVELEFEIETRGPEEGWVPDLVADFYDDAVRLVEKHAGGNQVNLANAAADALESRALTLDGATSVESNGAMASLSFLLPDDAPGYQPQTDLAEVVIDADGFVELNLTLGPWRADEPQADLAIDGADSMIARLNADYPSLEPSWRRSSREDEDDLTISVGVDRGTEAGELDPDSGGEIATLVSDVLMAAQRDLPAGRPEGVPPQGSIDEFVDARVRRRRVVSDVASAVGERIRRHE